MISTLLRTCAVVSTLTAMAGTAAYAQDAQPTSLSESYGSWIVSCRTAQAGAEGQEAQRVCQMSQNLQQQGGQRVLFIGLTRDQENGAAQMTAIAPFGLDLSEGFAIVVEENVIVEAPFETCLPAGCVVNAPVTMENISTMAAPETATARMVPNGNTTENPMTIEFRTDGFINAWNRLVELTGN